MRKQRVGELHRGRRAGGATLGLAVLALTVQATASGLGSSQDQPAAPTEPDVAHLTVAESRTEGDAETVADRATPKVPALEVGASPVGARRPVALDARRASQIGTLPGPAAYAYTFATSTLEEAEPRCGLSWSLLAAIGRLESNHGRAGDARLDDRGVVSPAIRSARLDGSSGTTKVRDTDAGDLDRDRRFDRAVGPMQLLPTTWDVVGVDADGDGRRDPDDIDDAALGAAVLLCGAPGRLTDREGLEEALERYNAAPGYAAAVIGLERKYRRTGVPVATLGGSAALLTPEPTAPAATLEALVIGENPAAGLGGPPVRTPQTGDQDGTGKGSKGDGKGKGKGDGKGDKDKGSKGKGKGDGKGDGKGPKGEPKPDPTCPELPSTTPAGPVPTEPTSPLTDVAGAVTCVAGAWYVGEALVGIGDDAWLAMPALADHDADTILESNLGEFTGLLDAEVTAGIDDTGTVWTLQGQPYLPTPVDPPTDPPTETPDPTPTPSPSPSPSPPVSSPPTPSGSPSRTPSPSPSPSPSGTPSEEPSQPPSDEPSQPPSDEPSQPPSDEPSEVPSDEPSDEPIATP